MKTYAVYIGDCSGYDTDRIADILRAALDDIPFRKPLTGRVVIKPNLVMAHPKIATEGYTRPQVIEAILRVVLERGKRIQDIAVVEKSGLGVTTASMFRWAGYKPLPRRYPVRLCAMEEIPHATMVLERGRVHRHVTVAREMAERDFLVFAPKLKTNVLSHAYTGALKLNIGTIDSKERVFHHHRDLPVKIVDLLEAANPDLVVTDGVRFAFGGNQMTEGGTDFGAVVVSTNAVAHDMVCARLIGLDPMKIEHIREAVDRGYGPRSFREIRVLGDFPLRRGQAIAKKLDFGFYPVDRFPVRHPCRFNVVSGTPYCTGGCQGIFLDWLHMVKDRKPKLLRRFPSLTVVIGKSPKPVNARRVLLLGDCATASADVRGRRIVRINGCPPTHKRIVWDMMMRFLLIAPLVRPSLVWDGYVRYPLKKIKGWWVNQPWMSRPGRFPETR
jgi:uncharacterized protein (DUF362 family)